MCCATIFQIFHYLFFSGVADLYQSVLSNIDNDTSCVLSQPITNYSQTSVLIHKSSDKISFSLCVHLHLHDIPAGRKHRNTLIIHNNTHTHTHTHTHSLSHCLVSSGIYSWGLGCPVWCSNKPGAHSTLTGMSISLHFSLLVTLTPLHPFVSSSLLSIVLLPLSLLYISKAALHSIFVVPAVRLLMLGSIHFLIYIMIIWKMDKWMDMDLIHI